MVQTESPALLSLQHWKHFSANPELIVNVVGDEGIVALRRPPLSFLGIIKEGQEEVVGIEKMQPQEVVGEGCEQSQHNHTSGGNEADEASVHPT